MDVKTPERKQFPHCRQRIARAPFHSGIRLKSASNRSIHSDPHPIYKISRPHATDINPVLLLVFQYMKCPLERRRYLHGFCKIIPTACRYDPEAGTGSDKAIHNGMNRPIPSDRNHVCEPVVRRPA